MNAEGIALLELRALGKTYGELAVLEGVDLALFPGDLVALKGASGCGKSTLLHIAGLLIRPNAGEVRINGTVAHDKSDHVRAAWRRQHFGFVYQGHYLLAEYDALGNVMLPALMAGRKRKAARQRARALLCAMGLEARLHHQPATLSGGEKQRVAIARALMNKPAVVLADEPTGNLDPATSASVFAFMCDAVRASGAAMLVATHDYAIAGAMQKSYTIRERKLCLVRREDATGQNAAG